ncbi:MAG: hypothetical protein LBV08_01800 [Clostridiales bacterium]|nr:hypothetical protein [Clostridiales bacterium]
MDKRHLFVLIIFIFLAGSIAAYLYYFKIYNDSALVAFEFTDYGEIYPDTPGKVIDENNRIVKLLYSGKLSDTDVVLALESQEQLFSEGLRGANSGYISYMVQEIQKYKDLDIQLSDISVTSLAKDEYSDKIYIAEVQQVFDESYINNVKYYIINENSKYSILAWEYFGGDNVRG